MFVYYQRKFVQIGGSEIFALSFFEEVNSHKKCFLFSLYCSEKCKLYIKKNYNSIYKRLITPSFSLSFLRFCLSFLFKKNIKIYFNYGLHEMFFLRMVFLRKIIYLAHDMFSYDEFKPISIKNINLLTKVRLKILGIVENIFSDVFVLTKKSQKERLRLLNYKPKVVNAAIRNLNSFEHNNKKKFILSLGRLEKKKNVDLIIKTFEKINKTNAKLKLHICGDGSQMKNLKEIVRIKKLSNNVSFFGFVSEKEKKLQIKDSLCIYCLDKADFDLVIWEALLQAKPVICSNTMEIDSNFIKYNWIAKSKLNVNNIYRATKILLKKKRNIKVLKKLLNDYTFKNYLNKIELNINK